MVRPEGLRYLDVSCQLSASQAGSSIPALRVLLADDHGIVRRGLKSLIERAAGKPFFSPAVTAMLVEDHMRQLQARGLTDSYLLLTDREKEVLQLLAEGRSNKEVATLLEVGVSTIETHRANLMQKLNLHNTADIVLYAVRKGIIV